MYSVQLILLLSFVAALASARLGDPAAGTSSKDVELRCQNVGQGASTLVCTVTLRTEGNVEHEIELEEDPVSLFTETAELAFGDGTKVKAREHANKDTVRLRSRVGSSTYATAGVSRDGSRLLEGVFAVPNKGFYEYDHGHMSPKDGVLRRRVLNQVGAEDELERQPGSPESIPTKSAGESQEWLANAANAPPNTYIPFFPGCYEHDSLTHVVRVNVALDLGVVSSLGGPGNLANILASVESTFAMGRLIFLAQLNIRVEVQTIVLGSATMVAPFHRSIDSNTCAGAQTAFDELLRWIGQENRGSQAAYWVLASNCFSGINGKSYVGSMCGTSGNGGVAEYSWPVIFHEMGHGIGMWHSFENGMGNTGGLMDYGNIIYNGIIQFHPLKRAETCAFLDIVKKMTNTCPHFFVASSTSSCGDGILSSTEECECLDRSKGCRGCVNCLKTDPTAQCSSSNFVMRDQFSPELVSVTAEALASPQCCSNGRLAPAKTLCGETLLNACGAQGRCAPICTRFLERNNPNCGFDEFGCNLGCMWEGQCRFDMPSTGDPNSPSVSALPDGSQCTYRGITGQCRNAVCHTSAGTPPPTRGTSTPTRSPFYNEQPDTFRPTAFPTAFPSKATKSPVTARPTDPGAQLGTSRPTPKTAGNVNLEVRCNRLSAKQARCRKRRGCKWCDTTLKCVFDLAAHCPAA